MCKKLLVLGQDFRNKFLKLSRCSSNAHASMAFSSLLA